ncbi:MAG TPA: serine/threonine-protein phosphatase [Anaerolineae bacterium]|nr:serine/threonine-protein phosphatase [Anaerolineae bacterium]
MIPASKAHLPVAARTHPGLKRAHNEDRFSVAAYWTPNKGTPSLLAVVADGMGGHRAGEVAAEIAVETVHRHVAASDGRHPAAILEQALRLANEAVRREGTDDDRRQGLGTTCVAAWVLGDRLYIASVGDSRIYLLREQTLHQLTTDHSWVQEAVEKGALTPKQARRHPKAHLIRRYLGAPKGVRPDLRLKLRWGESDTQARRNQGLPLRPGDRLLLCTDGLTDLVADEEIREVLQTPSLEEALDQLIALALERGGKDNITVVGISVPSRG